MPLEADMSQAATPTPLNPAIADLSRDNKVQILLAAYQKHANELLAIETSQEKLNNLVLAIYSAGLTLIAALAKDARTILAGPSPFAWTLIVLAIVLCAYALYMNDRRGHAREGVREALTRVEQALAFYAAGEYLQQTTLYNLRWLNYPKHTFLNRGVAIVVLAGLAFAVGIFLIAIS
jgi:hypothetical protein